MDYPIDHSGKLSKKTTKPGFQQEIRIYNHLHGGFEGQVCYMTRRYPPIAIAVVAAPCVSPPVADLIQLDLELC